MLLAWSFPLILAALPVLVILALVLIGVVAASAANSAGSVVNGCRVTSTITNDVVFPLPKGTWVTTSWWGTRTTPSGKKEWHGGHDYGAPHDTPILSAMTGTVTAVVFPTSGNNMIWITGTDRTGTRVSLNYVHSYKDEIYVKRGDQVYAGQIIALVGSSGRSTGPHLHLEMRRPANGAASEVHNFLNLMDAQQVNVKCED